MHVQYVIRCCKPFLLIDSAVLYRVLCCAWRWHRQHTTHAYPHILPLGMILLYAAIAIPTYSFSEWVTLLSLSRDWCVPPTLRQHRKYCVSFLTMIVSFYLSPVSFPFLFAQDQEMTDQLQCKHHWIPFSLLSNSWINSMGKNSSSDMDDQPREDCSLLYRFHSDAWCTTHQSHG